MLDPNYLLHISEGAEDISEKLHNDIISRIVERVMLRIGRGEDYLLTAQDKWQIENLQSAGYLLEDIQKDIAKATKLQQTEIAEAMEDAGVKALDYDDKIYQSVGLSPTPLTQSPELIRLMQRNYEATIHTWENFTRTMADEAQRLFINQLDMAYTLVSTGALSYTAAVKEVINHIVSDGVKVTYPTGHSDTIETATLRAVRTGISQATGQIQTARMDEMGVDLVLVSSHLGARPSHQAWQGKVYSKSGRNPKYLPFRQATGYGTVEGLCGANCRHSFGPYFEGMDNPFEQYNSKENLEQYEKEQRQRTLERRIRDSKREVLGLKQSLDNCEDDALREVLDREYQRKSALLAKQNKAYKDYCDKNGLKPLQDRLNIAQWNRKQAAAARGAAKRYENAHGGKISSLKNKPSDELKEINIRGIIDDYEKRIKELTEEKKNTTMQALMGDVSAIEKGKDVERNLRELKAEYEEFKKSHDSEISKLLKAEATKESEPVRDVFKPIANVSQAKQQLQDIGIKHVTDRISILNSELLVENVNQLTDLEKRFGAINKGKVNLTINAQSKSIAFVKSSGLSPDIQELSLSGKHFKNSIEDVIKKQMEQIEIGFKMPALKEKCSVYTITHEYGHILENAMINERYFKLSEVQQWEFKKDGLKYKLWKDRQAGELWSEIIKIAKELSGDELFLSYDYMSEYGQSNVYEAFAETFANSQLGASNIMGNAMNIWLERKGYK